MGRAAVKVAPSCIIIISQAMKKVNNESGILYNISKTALSLFGVLFKYPIFLNL